MRQFHTALIANDFQIFRLGAFCLRKAKGTFVTNFNFFSLFVTIIKKYIGSNKRSFLSNLELLNTVVPIITQDDDAIVQNLKIVFRPKRIKIDLNDKSNNEKRKQEI